MIQYVGIIYLFLLFVHIWAAHSVWGSGSDRRAKVLWWAILLFPLLGFLIWLFKGPKQVIK